MGATETARAAVAAYLQQHESKALLRFITCGSVDDGKSTLIGEVGGDRGGRVVRARHQK